MLLEVAFAIWKHISKTEFEEKRQKNVTAVALLSQIFINVISYFTINSPLIKAFYLPLFIRMFIIINN